LRYSALTVPMIKARGGTLLWTGNAKAVALGPQDGNQWDYVALVYYPVGSRVHRHDDVGGLRKSERSASPQRLRRARDHCEPPKPTASSRSARSPIALYREMRARHTGGPPSPPLRGRAGEGGSREHCRTRSGRRGARPDLVSNILLGVVGKESYPAANAGGLIDSGLDTFRTQLNALGLKRT